VAGGSRGGLGMAGGCTTYFYTLSPPQIQTFAYTVSYTHTHTERIGANRAYLLERYAWCLLSGVLQSVAVCCSVLQCAAVCCSVLQCVAVCCSVAQCGRVGVESARKTKLVLSDMLQCIAVCCSAF